MLTMQNVIDNIVARKRSRDNLKCYISSQSHVERRDVADIESACMLCEILDDFLVQKLQSDKVLEGILTDINNSVTEVADRNKQG